MESLAVASHPLRDLNRQGGSGEPPYQKSSLQKRKRREDFSSRRSVLPGGGFGVLFRTGAKVDEAAVLQRDAVGVSVVLLQVGGGHVEHPLITSPAEGDIRDIVVRNFVYVVNRAAHRVDPFNRAVAARKHRSW